MLHLHRAERADALVVALRDLLLEPLQDPFASEIVSVPTRGIERWLAQRLAHGLRATGRLASSAGVGKPADLALTYYPASHDRPAFSPSFFLDRWPTGLFRGGDPTTFWCPVRESPLPQAATLCEARPSNPPPMKF